MLDHRLSRCVLVGSSALAVLWLAGVLNWAGNPNWLSSGKLGLSLAICCALATWFWVRGPPRPAPPAEPPAYPGALPLIGHALLGLGNELNMWKNLKKLIYHSLENGGVTSVRIGVYPTYVLTDPDDCLTVANTCLDKPYIIYGFAKKWLGNGLVTADEKTWKLHRKMLNPAFNQQIINKFVDVFNEQARRLVEQLRGQVGRGFFDPEQYLCQSVLETTCRTTLNIKPEETNVCCVDYITASKHLMDVILERFQKLWLHYPLLFNLSSLKKKHDQYYKLIIDIFSTIIQNRKVKLHEMDGLNNVDNEDARDNCKTLLDFLFHLGAEQGVLTDSDIRDHVNTFIAASYDTTGSSLVLALVMLGSHQDVQERVYKELQEVLGDTDDNIDRHALAKLVYLEAVLKESLRLYPSAPMVAREAHEDVKLKNYTVPAGAFCILSIYGLNRHPMWGADAAQFRPERWLEPGGVPDHPNAFASFSMGRRNCIGKLYGLMSMKTTLAHLLRRYQVSADAGKLVLKWDAVLRAVSGYDIRLKLRSV